MPEDVQLFIKRVPRDNEMIASLEAEVVKFLGELDELLAKLLERRSK